MREQKVYSKNDLIECLQKISPPRDKVVLVHSSLRLIGEVEGGAHTVLDALIEYFTADGGLLCIPTHTWGNIGKEITLDLKSPSTCLGVLSNIAAGDKRGVRSLNPTHSLAVFGNASRALKFIEGEDMVASGTAPNSCYGKIFRENGLILLIGVSHNRNTYLHCAEEMIGVKDRLSKEPKEANIRLNSGEILNRKIHIHSSSLTNDISSRYLKFETAFRYHGAITDGFFGNAPVQCCGAVIMKETLEKIYKNSGDKDPLSDEFALDPKLYF